MDVHSRFSQFDNQSKRTKAGPQQATKPRLMEGKDSAKPQLPRKPSNPSSNPNASLFTRRAIATNSRVKQDEKTRKDMYLSFVNNALHQKSMGITEPFDELVNQFNPKRSPTELPFPQPAQLRLWLLALSHVVSRLERTHVALVESIVNMPWVTMDTATVKSYTVFMGVLLSARPEYLSLVLSKIAQGFTYQSNIQAKTPPDTVSTSPSITVVAGPPLTRRVIYDRLHYLLKHLLSLIPTLPSTLMPLLARNFPHKRQNTRYQSTYIKNLLRVSWYCPELSDGILELVVDRAIQIDVEIQVEIDDIEAEMGQSEGDQKDDPSDIFDIDLDTVVGQESSDVDSDSESNSSNDDEDGFSDLSSEGGYDFDDDEAKRAELPTNVKHIAEMVKKLDTILMLVFGHLEKAAGFEASLSMLKRSSSTIPETSSLPELPPLDLPTVLPVATPLPIADIYAQSLSSPASSRSSTPTLGGGTIPISDIPSTQDDTSLSSKPTSELASLEQLSTPSRTTMEAHFHTLLSIFDRIILRTFKSRYTQFILFWYTSLDAEFADVFLGMLVERSLYSSSNNPESHHRTDTSSPAITRAAAASYIGSFVSRANFVDTDGARRVVGVLCEWLEAHLEAVEKTLISSSSSNNALNALGTHNSVFYAVAQAVFLIFCFRWRDLLVEDHPEDTVAPPCAQPNPPPSSTTAGPGPGQKWLPELNVIQRIVTSVLNPLRACSPAVAAQFAKVAHATGFIYVYSILESNKRSDGSDDGSRRPSLLVGANAGLSEDLNTFFPFDPYNLPRSNKYIEERYRVWKDVAIDDDDDDEDEENDDEDSEEDETDKDKNNVVSQTEMAMSVEEGGLDQLGIANGLGASFGAMSISPARPGVEAIVAIHGP